MKIPTVSAFDLLDQAQAEQRRLEGRIAALEAESIAQYEALEALLEYPDLQQNIDIAKDILRRESFAATHHQKVAALEAEMAEAREGKGNWVPLGSYESLRAQLATAQDTLGIKEALIEEYNLHFASLTAKLARATAALERIVNDFNPDFGQQGLALAEIREFAEQTLAALADAPAKEQDHG